MILLKRCTRLAGMVFCFLPILSVAQVADFQADVVSGCPPSLIVHFTDKSTGGATSWSWDFGNGNSSVLQNPSAIYTQPGSYNVTLTINGGSTKTRSNYITVYEKPTVNFSANVTSGCASLNVPFTNTSTAGSGTISSYAWVFGDGGTSTEASPQYLYTQPSIYSVTLTVTNQYNCATSLVKNSLINVKGPVINFNANQTSFCQAPASANFTNSTSGIAPITYQWNFGDNTPVVNQPTPSHSFTSPGSYDVTLSATDASGCSASQKKTSFINIGNDPGVNFSVSSAKVCIGQSVIITNQTTVPVTSTLWDFGNGSQSSDVNTSVTYTSAGFYDVVLKAKLPSGCEVSVTKKIEVAFDAFPDFKIVPACNRKITFNNLSQRAFSFAWDFGDGITSFENEPVHTYTASGSFNIKLTGYNSLNCPVIIEKEITVNDNPIAGILPDKENSCTEVSLAGCAPFALQFTNNTVSTLPLKTTLWTFGDNTNSPLSSPLHTYTTAGVFNVMLVVTNSLNCRDTARAIVKVSATKPTADFSVNKTEICVGEKISFTNLSTASDFWCWDFGDTHGSNSKSPDYVYKKPGVYTVTLAAKNAGCTDVKVKTQLIRVKDPHLEFSVLKNCDTPYDIMLVNKSENYSEFSWSLGDGTANNVTPDNLNHHFQATGNYNVKLTIKSALTGCVVKDSVSVVIQDIKSDFEPAANPICKNNAVAFNDRSEFATSWKWNFKDGTISERANPVKAFSIPGTYNVSLTVTDSDGCSDNKVIPIKVADIEGGFNYTASSICTELTVNFKDASNANPPIQNWLWDFGDTKTSTDQNPVHVYSEQNSYPVRLTLQNAETTCSILVADAVVFTNPVADFSASKTAICVDEPITFLNKSTKATTFSWDFGNSKTLPDPTPTMAYADAGKYTVILKAKDQYGCEKSIIKTEYIEVSKPFAQFEAFQTSAECPPLITTFKNKSSTDVIKWSWTFGDGQFSSLQNPTNTYQIPGVYDVTLEVINSTGCSAKTKVDGLVSLGGPYGNFEITSPIACINDPVLFHATATNTVKYIWDFGDGNVLETDKNDVSHIYANAARATISLILVDSKGCRVALNSTKKADIKNKPEVDFEFGPEYPFEGESVTLTAIIKEQLDLIWKFDEEAVAGGTNMEKSFDVYGVHTITLTGTNAEGCSGTAEKKLLVQADVKLIPNVFTPNHSDNYNPTFWIEDVEKGFWELRIYNRWGQLVHKQQDYINEWDGGNLSAGVYYYHLINRYRQSKDYKGYIQLIR